MRNIRIIFSFYKIWVLAGFLVTALCIIGAYREGVNSVTPLLLGKIGGNAAIIIIVNIYFKQEFYYYKNLGLSKQLLWISTQIIEFIFFVIILSIFLPYVYIPHFNGG